MTIQLSVAAIEAAILAGNEVEARNLLDTSNEMYYADGSSPITDAEYDTLSALFNQAFTTPVKTGARNTARTDRHANVQHDWPMLSGWLDKAADTIEMNDWFDKRITTLNQSENDIDPYMLGSPKWDGLSIVITYDNNGNVIRALTRGEHGFGVDVTNLFAGERHFSTNEFSAYDFGRLGVKYEVVMRWTDVERMSDDLGKIFKNPRNTVAGIVSSDDGANRRQYITLVPLDIDWDDNELSRIERWNIMNELFTPIEDGAPPVFTGNGDRETPFIWSSAYDHDELVNLYNDVHSMRDNIDFDYMLDGIVIEFASTEAVEALGGVANDCPPYSVAVKFPSMVGRTSAISVDWDYGNSGRLTPVVNYEPITLDGRTFKRTSLSNMIRFDALKLAFGTPIIVEIRGDVIAWVDRDGPDIEGTVPFPAPEDCIYTRNKDGQRVFAYTDVAIEGRIERMMIKMGIKGVRIETIRKLSDAGLLPDLSSIWSVEQMLERVASIPGMGESSADILCTAIETKLTAGFWDWEVLSSVGINSIGRSLSKDALGVWTLDELLGDTPLKTENLTAVIGPERTRALLAGVELYADDIRALKDIALQSAGGLRVTKEAQSFATGECYKVVVTGDLAHWERDAFKTYIETLGHKMVSSMSKKVDFLITNDPSSGTIKNKKATDLGIRIITENQAIEILGLERPTNGIVTTASIGNAPLVVSDSLDDL